MIFRRPPQAVHSLRSEETTRASRVAHRSRWPQEAALASPSAADGSAAWPARCGRGPGPGAPGHLRGPRRSGPAIRVCRMQGKSRAKQAQGRRRTPVAGSFRTRRRRWPARAPVAVIPRTEAAVRAASTGSSSVSGSAAVSSSRPRGAQADDAARTRLHDLLHGLVGQRRGRNQDRSVLPIDADPAERGRTARVRAVAGRAGEHLSTRIESSTRPITKHALSICRNPISRLKVDGNYGECRRHRVPSLRNGSPADLPVTWR